MCRKFSIISSSLDMPDHFIPNGDLSMVTLEAISDGFLSARRSARFLEAFPGEVPQTLEDAYAVQTRSIAHWNEPLIGFKVGGVPTSWRSQYSSEWLAGAVFPSNIHRVETGGSIPVGVFEGGFAAYEPELIFELWGLQELVGRKEPIVDLEEAKTFVVRVYIGAEIASSPLATINALGPASIISDFGNNIAAIIGPEIDRKWLNSLDEIDCTLTIDGSVIGRKSPDARDNGPLGALRFLLNHLRKGAPQPLSESAYLCSGAITGVHEASIGTTGRFDYGVLGTFEVSFVKQESSS